MFCREYIKDLNVSRAYLEVYPKGNASSGTRLVQNVKVQQRIQELFKERSERVEGDGDLVLKMLRNAALVNLHYWYDLGHQGMSMDRFKEMPEEVQLLVTSVKEKITKTGDDFVTYVEVDFLDKKFALEKLGSHEGLWKNNHNIKLESYEKILRKAREANK
jgi:hypothetical protein